MKLDNPKNTTTAITKEDRFLAQEMLTEIIKGKVIEQATIEIAACEVYNKKPFEKFDNKCATLLIGRILNEVSHSSLRNSDGVKISLINAFGNDIQIALSIVVNEALYEINKFNNNPNYVEDYKYEHYKKCLKNF